MLVQGDKESPYSTLKRLCLGVTLERVDTDPKQSLSSCGITWCFQRCTHSALPGRSVTEHCISFWAGFPFSRTFWASQVQGKGEASSSCRQMEDEEEKRGASRGDGWAVGCQCHSQVPFVGAGPVSCGVSLPSSAQGGRRPQAALGSLRFSPSLEFPWVSHKSLSLVGNPFSRSGGGEEGGPGLIPSSPWGCEVF